jgi:hypothetical protein
MGPTGVSKEKAMRKHRGVPRRIVVILGVKARIAIVHK